MILADKIINERKKNGWSQEELAEQLSVSRQSVSKWEGAQSVPDLQKILKMAEIFGVSTDYLLKDELEPLNVLEQQEIREEVISDTPLRRVSMEEANAYLDMEKKNVPLISNAISLCILSPVLLLFLAALAESGKYGITEALAAGIGIIVLFLIITVAVCIFVYTGSLAEPYEYLDKEVFETEYGVSGMVTEKKKAYESRYAVTLAMGISLCILSSLPLLVAGAMDAGDFVCEMTLCILLIVVAGGVNLIVRTCSIKESYEKILQENDYTRENKKTNAVTERFAAAYWCVVTAIFLIWGYLTKDWQIVWIVWPIGALIYAIVVGIIKMTIK